MKQNNEISHDKIKFYFGELDVSGTRSISIQVGNGIKTLLKSSHLKASKITGGIRLAGKMCGVKFESESRGSIWRTRVGGLVIDSAPSADLALAKIFKDANETPESDRFCYF